MSRDDASIAINKWAKRLKVEEYLPMAAEKLSKGNQQKIQFMTAVIHNPDLVVLDEPFSGLDPVNTDIIKSIIIDLVRQGKFIIMSAHQMATIEEFCTNILILNRGKTVLQGNLKDIKSTYPAILAARILCKENRDAISNSSIFHSRERKLPSTDAIPKKGTQAQMFHRASSGRYLLPQKARKKIAAEIPHTHLGRYVSCTAIMRNMEIRPSLSPKACARRVSHAPYSPVAYVFRAPYSPVAYVSRVPYSPVA